MKSVTTPLDKHEQLQARRREMQAENALLAHGSVEIVAARPTLSSAAKSMQQALPAELLREGAIEYDAQGQPKVAWYDARLLAPSPQRGRIVDRNLDKLASSLDAHGQQEAILGRLITETDRMRFPGHFEESQRLVILKGHRIYFALSRAMTRRKLRVELLLPEDGESEQDYIRRAFVRASIKLMHSEAYTILDKVNLYERWIEEFSLSAPNDSDTARHFEISHDEARRLRVVAKLDTTVAQAILNSEHVPADEVIYQIASRPAAEQQATFERFGRLSVAAVRRLLKEEKAPPDTKVMGRMDARPFMFAFKDESSSFRAISTDTSAREWRKRGGAQAFLRELRTLLNDPKIQRQLQGELG